MLQRIFGMSFEAQTKGEKKYFNDLVPKVEYLKIWFSSVKAVIIEC